MLYRSTVQLLRFHFSFFLMPVFLFAVSQVEIVDWEKVFFTFFILHVLVYPASNGYNSYMDRDSGPIGGLQHPMQPTRQLFRISMLMDGLALIFSMGINKVFALGIMFYILASRAYSYRGIRLKRFPLVGFITVFIFQGAAIFFIVYHGCSANPNVSVPVLPCVVSSLLIGALYPLTQIYQHEEDKNDGVITISYLLGKRGSFIFSGLQFILATLLLYFYFSAADDINNFFLFLGCTFPVVLFFSYWMFKVWANDSEASFKNSFRMNIVATLCTSGFFASLIFMRLF